jgi:membrane protein implicated in regulation of membrane protease activity
MRFVLPPLRRPRHPLARALSLLVGMALVALLLVFGLVVGGVLLIGGGALLALRYWTRGQRKVAAPSAGSNHRPEVLEGEFVVVHQRGPAAH